MYLMYVDESGDPGVTGSGSGFYILSGLIIHELSWKPALDDLIALRRSLRDSRHSFFIQLADVFAYFAHQSFKPNKVVKKQGATYYYRRLGPAIIKKAAPSHPFGIVVAKKMRGAYAPPGSPTTHSGQGSDSP